MYDRGTEPSTAQCPLPTTQLPTTHYPLLAAHLTEYMVTQTPNREDVDLYHIIPHTYLTYSRRHHFTLRLSPSPLSCLFSPSPSISISLCPSRTQTRPRDEIGISYAEQGRLIGIIGLIVLTAWTEAIKV